MVAVAEHPVVARARELRPLVRAASEEIERERRLPDDLDAKLAAAGLHQLYLAEIHGGVQADPVSATRAIEEIAKGDASAAWVCMIGSVLTRRFSWLDPAVVQAMRERTGPLRASGSNRALGRARIEGDGYIVGGRWNYQSAIDRAGWMFGTCIILDGDDAVRDDRGRPLTKAMAIPTSEGTIHDTWDVVGLRGSSSFDFEVNDLYVPAAHAASTQDPPFIEDALYLRRFASVWGHALHGGLTLGIARGALDEFYELASARSSTMQTTLLRDRPFVQTKVGEAEAILHAARAFLYRELANAWEAANEGRDDPSSEIATLRLAITHAGHESVRAVDLLFHAAGTNAIHRANRLERSFRDVHVAVQHLAAAPKNYETAGRVMLDLPAEVPGW